MGVSTKLSQRYRELRGFFYWWFLLFSLVALTAGIFYIFGLFSVFRIAILEQAYFAIILGLYLPLAFLIKPATESSPRDKVPWYDLVLSILSLGLPLYVAIFAMDITRQGWGHKAPLPGMVLGMLSWGLYLELARRYVGVFFAVVVGLFSIYPLIGHLLPESFLTTVPTRLPTLVAFQFLSPEGGTFGLITRVIATLLIGFLVFAAALEATGGAKIFLDLALRLMGRYRGGAAKVCVLASAFFATLSGSVISNVVTIGSFTIPTMKRTGYAPHEAAAIEACASTGGPITPPVMGSVAFLMATFLEIPYLEVCIAAAIPALLYFWCLFCQVDLFAIKRGLRGVELKEVPSVGKTLRQGYVLIVAILVLVLVLYRVRIEAQAPYYAMAVMFFLFFLGKGRRVSPHRVLLHFLAASGRTMAEMVGILVPVGMISGAVSFTGTGISFSSVLGDLAGGNVFLLLLATGLASFILGMGLPVAACYIFLALLIGPALIEFGINPLAAHLFIMYWALSSFITPPVATAVFAASSLAGAKVLQTGFTAMRIGMILFVIPFFFVIDPALVLQGGSPLTSFLHLLSALIGVPLMTCGLQGYLYRFGKLNIISSITCFISGLSFLYPSWQSSILGVLLLAGVVAGKLLKVR